MTNGKWKIIRNLISQVERFGFTESKALGMYEPK